jgi:hypothetical protein
MNRVPGFIALRSARTLLLMMAAILFAVAPAGARPQETSSVIGAEQSTGTTQSTQTPPVAAQDKDKKDQKKDEKDDPTNPKNDRIFLVIPNYGTVEHPTANVPPLTVKQKFKTGAEDAFDTYSIPLAGVVAAISQAKNDDAAWGQGWGAFGKRYAATYADTVIGSFMTTGVYPSLLHEDPRYFRMGSGGFKKRSWYAVTRLFVIRTDAGKHEFNYSEFLGNATAAGISLTYHTSQERNFSSFAGDYATQIAIDAFANQLKEFWPDIRHKLHHKK